MAKYNNIKELSVGFKNGELYGWVLAVDNDSTHLRWTGTYPEDEEELCEFEDLKYKEGKALYDGSKDIYILDQALTLAGIPNEGV